MKRFWYPSRIRMRDSIARSISGMVFITRNLLTVPVKKSWSEGQIGVLQAVNRIGGAFSDNDITVMELLADQAGVAIQRYRLQMEVVRSAGLHHEMELAQKVQMP